MVRFELQPMADTRAMTTDREREIVTGEDDEISDDYEYQTTSRVRRRFRRVPGDLDAFAAHGGLIDDFLRAIAGWLNEHPEQREVMVELLEDDDG